MTGLLRGAARSFSTSAACSRAAHARAHLAMARHRQKVGGLSRDELERLKGRPLSASEEAFLREVQGKGE